jgi:hypothetical protein
MGFYSAAARKELETIKEIRNEFAHRIARSFDFERIRDLAKNLSLSERTEFYVSVGEGGAVLYVGPGSKPADRPSEPILPVITPDELTPRERYLRACQFYSAALGLITQTASPFNPPVYF